MFANKLLTRPLFIMNVSRYSIRNFIKLPAVYSVLNFDLFLSNRQRHVLNGRTIVSYERKTNDQTKNVNKVSRTLISMKYLRLIKNAIRENGPVIKTNKQLAFLIESAQRNHLSPDFINFAIRISVDIKAKVGLYDLLLSNGCHFLIQYEDIDSAITKHHLLGLCERFDASIFQSETLWPKTFEMKGMIFIRCSDSDPLANINKEELISKIGIESYQKDTDAEGIEYWKLFCDPWQLPKVKKQLKDITEHLEESCIGFIPKKIITPMHHTRSSVYNILFKLSEVPTIDNVYCNIKLSHYMS